MLMYCLHGISMKRRNTKEEPSQKLLSATMDIGSLEEKDWFPLSYMLVSPAGSSVESSYNNKWLIFQQTGSRLQIPLRV